MTSSQPNSIDLASHSTMSKTKTIKKKHFNYLNLKISNITQVYAKTWICIVDQYFIII